MLAALFEVVVLVVAGGRGAQQDGLAGARGGAGLRYRRGEVAAAHERDSGAPQVARETLRSRADQVRGPGTARKGVAQPGEAATLEAAAEDRVHAARLEGLDPDARGIDVRRLRVVHVQHAV